MTRRILPIAVSRARWSGRDIVRAFAALLALGIVAGYFVSREDERIAGAARAVDGDSLFVDGTEIRLEGIDAPELAQSCEAGGGTYRCGEDARRALVALLARGSVECRSQGRDRYGRRLARCRADGADLGAGLVSRGWAIATDDSYAQEEATARRARHGLWAGTFETPAVWRRAHPRTDAR